MDFATEPKVVGALVTIGLCFFILARELSQTEWETRIRHVLEEAPTRQGVKRGFVRAYVERLKAKHRLLDRPFDKRKMALHVGILFSGLLIISLLLRYNPMLSIVLSGCLTLFLYDRRLTARARRREEKLLGAWLIEAVPIGIHALSASGRLDYAFSRMADQVHYGPLKTRLKQLVDLARAPQFATPTDAFLHWTEELGIPSLVLFAVATKEATRYQAPLEELWLDMGELLNKDLEYRRNIRSLTSHFRSGSYILYAMLAGTLLIAYPFTGAYMSANTKIFFWVSLVLMTFGLWQVLRRSQYIDT